MKGIYKWMKGELVQWNVGSVIQKLVLFCFIKVYDIKVPFINFNFFISIN